MSFLADKVIAEGLTFDDVLLIPSYSEVLPQEVDLCANFTRNIRLNTPIVTSGMDTVTDARMAIAIAREGGIGVIHSNMNIEEQVRQVSLVKRTENGMIANPVTITADKLVKDALDLMNAHNIGGIPVIDAKNTLIGIVTNRDVRFETDLSKPVSEVMTRDNLIYTTAPADLEKAADLMQNYKVEKLPVVDKLKKLIGLVTYKDITSAKQKPLASKDQFGRLLVAASVAVDNDSIDRIDELVKANVDVIVIDAIHGHSRQVLQTLTQAKNKYPEIDFVAGNIATAEAASDLVLAGADGVKVGFGPGSICTTRVVAGVGMPQLSAIYSVFKALRHSDVPIIADGGIRYSGDIVKAIAAGAHCIMAGSLFAGVEESPGETIIFQGRKFKSYRSMDSLEAMQDNQKEHHHVTDEEEASMLVPGGIVGRVPYKGTLAEVLFQLTGGLRAGMSYCGAKDIKSLQHARFVRITSSGMAESHAHDVAITKDAPNYSSR